jgi:PAS domain S-box-containing protein
VDDDELVIDYLCELLSSDGHEVLTATSGEAALACLELTVPCMALLDVMMPGMDGLSLCKLMKQNPYTAGVPVALVSAQVTTSDIDAGLAAGAVDFMKKSFDPDEFRVRVRSQIQLHEMLARQRRIEKRLSLICSAAKDAVIIIDNEGAITDWNDASRKMFGYAADEVLGKNLPDLIAPKRCKLSYQPAFAQFDEGGHDDTVGRTVELQALRKSGEEFPIELSLSSATIDGDRCAIGIFRDLSERKAAERALRQSAEEYRMLFQASRDALVTLAPPSWRFVSCNEATLLMFGITSEAQFAKLALEDLLPELQPDGQSSIVVAQAALATAMSEGVSNFVCVHKRLDGGELPCEVLLTRMERGSELFLQGSFRDISARVKAAEALRASEARYRANFEDVSVGQALSTIDGAFIEANQALANMLGYELTELHAKNFGELMHPEDLPKILSVRQSLLEGQPAGRGDIRCLRKDGSLLWADISMAGLRTSADESMQFVSHFVDISERKCLEQLAEERADFMNMLMGAIPVPVFHKNIEGYFVGANKAFEKVTEKNTQDIVGKTAFDIFPLDQAQYHQSKDEELYAHPGTQIYNARIKSSTGAVRDVIVHQATFLNPNGQLAGIIGAMLDETERRRAEADLADARKLEAVGQLAAGIAHEINTPAQYVGDGIYFLKEVFESCQQLITVYRNATEAMERCGVEPELVNTVKELEEEVDWDYLNANVPGSFDRCVDGISRIATIVRAMKEFSHPDQREKSPADLNQALRNTLIIAHNEYKYVAEVETKLGDLPHVMCHLGDLNQVFLNLIVNAAHAIGDVIDKEKEKGKIRISTQQEGDWVRIDIADSGAGIPEAVRDRIFEPFFTTKPVGKGSGQGLPIARSIVVDKHNGSLTFESEVGQGTTFTIRLPINGGGTAHKEP